MVSFLQNVARQFKVAITGTIGCGVPVKVQCPMPTQSPFVHLLDGAPCQGLTAAQLAWAEWITQHPVSPQHNVGYPDYPQIHNTSFFIDDEGKVLGEYTKRNLWHSERWVRLKGHTLTLLVTLFTQGSSLTTSSKPSLARLAR